MKTQRNIDTSIKISIIHLVFLIFSSYAIWFSNYSLCFPIIFTIYVNPNPHPLLRLSQILWNSTTNELIKKKKNIYIYIYHTWIIHAYSPQSCPGRPLDYIPGFWVLPMALLKYAISSYGSCWFLPWASPWTIFLDLGSSPRPY